MSIREEDVRSRSASSPAVPPPWVFSPVSRSHYDEDASSSSFMSGSPHSTMSATIESWRPSSVPPEGILMPTTPPKPPPLPAPHSIKERRKYSRKYGSGVWSELTRDASLPTQSRADASGSYSIAYPAPSNDPYITAPSISSTYGTVATRDTCT